MIRLHRLLREHPDRVEADIRRFQHLDLIDYFRRDANGRRLLSTRRLLVAIRHIPSGQGAALHSIDGPEWDTTVDILDLIRRTIHAAETKGHKDPGAHPAHPAEVKKRTVRHTPARQRKLAAALARKRQREADIAAGRIS